MARYRADFNAMANGNAVGSTFVWRQNNGAGASANIVQNGADKMIQTNATGVGTKVLAYAPVNDVNDIEIVANFTFQRDVGKQGILSARYGGTAEANTTGFTLSGSFINNAGQLAIDEGGSGYVTWTPWNYLPNVNYWVRFRVVGNNVKAKVWTNGQAEPAGWMLDRDTTLRPTGNYSGLHQYNTGWINYQYLSFGTAGQNAPLPGESLVDYNYAELRRFNGTSFVQKPYKVMKGGVLVNDRAKILVNGEWRIIR